MHKKFTTPPRYKIETQNRKGKWKEEVGGWSERENAENYGRRFCEAGKWRVIDTHEKSANG